MCKSKSVYFELDHHPKGFSELLKEYQIQTLDEALLCEELWSLNNGRTICQPSMRILITFPDNLRGKGNIILQVKLEWLTL